MSVTDPPAAELGRGPAPHVQRLLAGLDDDIERGVLPLTVYNDADIYQLELERIFGRCWMFVAHETELPRPGDFVLRHIGQDPWIVVRGDDDVIRVLFNSCRHRGTEVCRSDRGNASHFMCPYHGWTYKNTGQLTGVPNRTTAYQALEDTAWSLLQAPRVASYRQLIFACLDDEGPTLDEYLGDFRWYLDVHLALFEGGMTVLADPHRWRIAADWKSGAENFSGDSYHTQTLHRSIPQIGLAPLAPAVPISERATPHQHVIECSGHATSMRRSEPGGPGFWGYPAEVTDRLRLHGLTPQQVELGRTMINASGNVFPNLSFLHVAATDDPAVPPVTYLTLRQWQPLGPGRMEAWNWVLAPSCATDDYRRRAYRAAAAHDGPSGNVEQDDTVAWLSIARAAGSLFARKANAKLNYQMGKTLIRHGGIPDWPGPGVALDTNLEDGGQLTLWRHWKHCLAEA
jgi:PAH dioxygenase large subunit